MSPSLENATSTRVIGYARPVLLIITLLALTGIGLGAFPSAAKDGRAIPAPALDEPHDATFEVAVLAGGCFSGRARRLSARQGREQCRVRLFRRRQGDGAIRNGKHGHNRACEILVKITFDPRTITYGRLLQKSISRSPMIRPSSTGRDRTWVPNIGRRMSRHLLSRLGLRKPTSPNQLWLILGDGVNQAADLVSGATSIPSRNLTPLMTFGN